MLLGKSPQIGITKVSTLWSTEKLYPLQLTCASQILFNKLWMSIVTSVSGRSLSDRSSSDIELARSELRKVESFWLEENSVLQRVAMVASEIAAGILGGRLGLLVKSFRGL